jgi:peptidoglycan hydrolase-like protein with peptidoglycan-binding domain
MRPGPVAFAGRRHLERLRVWLMSPGDLFGDVEWEQPARPRARAAPAPSAPVATPRIPVAVPRAPDRPRPRPRPTRRTFLIRRATALGILLLAVGGVAVMIAAPGGGHRSSARRTAPAGTGGPSPVAAHSALDQLVRADRTLAPGARGEPVRRLQQTLAVLGMSPGPADGIFSDGTRAAVIAFQNAQGIAPTGTVDRPTAAALRRALAQWAAIRSATIRQGLANAVARGRLPAAGARQDRRILTDAVLRLVRLPAPRAGLLSAVLTQLAAQAPVYDRPRALALFGMLDVNAHRLAAGRLPTRAGVDVTGTDGTVYRYFPDKGFQFHPLANFARLNGYVRARRTDSARRLAAALEARAIPAGRTLVWEYYFPYGGPSRWTSALAQSVAAQALMRTARTLHDPATARAATAAFNAIPGRLARPLGVGQRVREYSWSDEAILNAQLQSIVSLSYYAAAAPDPRAAAFVQRLAKGARAMLPELDTGSWSRYSIGGEDASRHYHCYHVSLLSQLAKLYPRDAVWSRYRTRWQGYADARGGCQGA